MGGRTAVFLAVGTLAVLTGGCEQPPPERCPVRGRVHLRDQPLAGGTIVFAPDIDRGTPDELLVGQIASDGSYQVKTAKGLSAAPGWYRVSVVSAGPRNSPNRVPDRYRDPIRSGLVREVRRSGENVIEFRLE